MVLTEVYALERVRYHPRFVRLLDVLVSRTKAFLVMDIYEMNLHAATEARLPLGFRAGPLRTLLHDISEGLQYLHVAGLVHTDLKPHNIMCQSDGCWLRARIADLGCATQAVPSQTTHFPFQRVGAPRQ